MFYRFVDRFISVRDIKKNKNSIQNTRFVLFMFIAVDGLNRDRADGGREAIFVQPGSQGCLFSPGDNPGNQVDLCRRKYN